MTTTTTGERSADTARQSHDVVTRLYSAINDGDQRGATELLTDDVTWTVPDSLPAGGAYHGRMAVGTYLKTLGETWHALEHRPERFVEDDRHVVVTGQSALTSSLTGEKDRIPFAHVMKVHGGKIAAFDEFTDTRRMAKLIGNPGSTEAGRGRMAS
jgi:ketosteroid isomerase-like protein